MRAVLRATLACGVTVAGLAAGCSNTAPARPQILLTIDTDAHVVGELPSSPTVSPDSTIDTLRVDVLDDHNNLVALNTFVVADVETWPLSFGIEPSPSFGSEVRVWIRAFRGMFATSDLASNGTTTLAPPTQVTIDRLVALPLPTAGVREAHVTLRYDCVGTASSFGSPLQTCLGATQLAGDPHQGLDAADAGSSSSVGTWQPALEVACNSAPTSGRVCIPGGFFFLGDIDAAGNAEIEAAEPTPLRPVIMSPFWLDTYEVTVQRLRALVNAGSFTGPLPTPTTPSDPTNQYCSWLGAADASHDTLPLNCVPYATAEQVCKLAGGTLATEAQWEYAARGRGERLNYPWGDTPPQCCSASLSRTEDMGGSQLLGAQCSGAGLEPVGSHPVSAACTAPDAGPTGGMGDVTRDGVYDMAGSLSEMLGDDMQSYSAACWNPGGILRDPVCQATNATVGQRGGSWAGSLPTCLLPLRNYVVGPGTMAGFRCAYADGSP